MTTETTAIQTATADRGVEIGKIAMADTTRGAGSWTLTTVTVGRNTTEKVIMLIRMATMWTGTGTIAVNFGYNTRGE